MSQDDLDPAASRAGATLQARLRLRLEEGPERPALGFYDGRTLRWLSRRELHARASVVAARLAEHGLRPGGSCLVVLPSGEQAATVVFAVLLLGGVPLLMSPPLLHGASLELPRLFARCAARSGARLAVCADPLLEMRDLLERSAGRARCLFARDLSHARPSAPGLERPYLPAATDVAAMQLTSGTTGVPRICVWDQRGVLAALDGMAAAMALSKADICCNWTPLYHDMGLVNNYLLCLTYGVPLVLLSPHDFIKRPALWLRALAVSGATHTWSPNFGFAVAVRKVRDEEIAGVRLEHVRAFWNAAERIHLGTLEAFHRRFAASGVRREALKTNFGCAENVGGATFSEMSGPFLHESVDLALLQRRGIARPAADGDVPAMAVVGVGKPNPGITITILSRRGEPLPDGHVGEIALATPSRLLRYQKDARATRRALHGDLLRTGDLGYLRGGELFWVGRVRERITIQGRKVDPSDLEAALAAVSGLREGCFAAFGVFDPQLGTERVVVASEVRDSAPAPFDAIREEVRRQVFLHLGVTVSEVLLLPPAILTKTSSGKRRHRHFRRLYLEGRLQALALSVPPPTALRSPATGEHDSRP